MDNNLNTAAQTFHFTILRSRYRLHIFRGGTKVGSQANYPQKLVRVSDIASATPGGQAAHVEDQIEEEKLRKNERKWRRMRKQQGNILFCPPQVETLNTLLVRAYKIAGLRAPTALENWLINPQWMKNNRKFSRLGTQKAHKLFFHILTLGRGKDYTLWRAKESA